VPLTLIRLDDRLIHGQVVVGWGHALGAERILLVDDHVAATEWERDLYRVGVPPGMEVEFTSVADAGEALNRSADSSERTIVLMADVDTLIKVCASCSMVRNVNVGGLHEREGRKQRLPYVFLSDDEAARLKELRDSGVEVTVQDVPTTKPMPLSDLV